jgi:DNA polymerase-4
MRKIIHVDMDAFYASIEERENPNVKNLPVVISGPPKSRSVVSTCNYIARTYGIHSAMPATEAYRLCPNAVFIEPRINFYKEVSREINYIFQEYTSLIEPLSLDEAYLDVTESCNKQLASSIAKKIKADIMDKTRLTCSAGVSFNKLIAKIASDWNKPNGLTVVPPEKVEIFFNDLPVKKIFGIGKKTTEKLFKMGISKASDLWPYKQYELVNMFGKAGDYFYHAVRGIDDRPVITHRNAKSIGRETTFPRDIMNMDEIVESFIDLLNDLNRQVKKNHYSPKQLNVKIRYSDFTTITRVISHFHKDDSREEIVFKIHDVLKQLNIEQRGIRLIGLSFTKLHTDIDELNRLGQLSLF